MRPPNHNPIENMARDTTRISLKERVQQVREEAIISSVNRLLAEKGFEAMTVDEVAADVGIAKASLYKSFSSKEVLAAAAMTRVLQRALEQIGGIAAEDKGSLAPIARLEAIVRWTMRVQLAGEMPTLPSQNSTLRAALMADTAYMDTLMELSERLGEWITAAQSARTLDPALPPDVILYTLFARACDPVLALLKAGGQYDDDKIVEMLLSTCFNGLAGRR